MSNYTAEQVEAMARVLDANQQIGAIGMIRNARDMLRAYAATLRQQAERGDGAVSDAAVLQVARRLDKAFKVEGGPDNLDWDDFVNAVREAVAPLLRAPAEQANRLEYRFGEGGIGIVPGDVAGRPAVFLTEVAAPGEVGKPIPEGECGETRVVLTFPTKEQASSVAAALAQNAQSEAELAGYVDAEQVADMKQNGGAVQIGSLSERYGRTVPVYYLHAERAMVPGIVNAFDKAVADELPRVSHVQFDSHEICEHFAGKVRERLLAAATQPEDAA